MQWLKNKTFRNSMRKSFLLCVVPITSKKTLSFLDASKVSTEKQVSLTYIHAYEGS